MHQPYLANYSGIRDTARKLLVREHLIVFTVAMSRYEDLILSVSDAERTNNFDEAWNRQFETLVGRNNPTIIMEKPLRFWVMTQQKRQRRSFATPADEWSRGKLRSQRPENFFTCCATLHTTHWLTI